MLSTVSFEFTNEKINIAVGRLKANNLVVSKCFSVDLPKNIINDGKINNINIVADMVLKVMKEQSIKSWNAIFLINSTVCFSRKIELPYLKSRKETKSMIGYNLADMFSKNINPFKYKYKTIELFIKDGVKYASYIVDCMPLEMYEQYLELAKKLKLNLKRLDFSSDTLENIGLMNLKVNIKHYSNENINIFIRIQKDSLSFSAINKGINEFNRINYIQADDYNIEMVAENTAEFDVDRSKYSKSNSSSFQTSYIINNFLDIILKYFKYYSSINKENRVISKIYIYGNGYYAGIEKDISSVIQMDVERLESISNISYGYEVDSSNVDEYFHCMLSLFSNKNTNFLTEKLKYSKLKFNIAISIMFLTAMLIFFVSIKGIVLLYQSISNKNEIKTMSMFINSKDNIALNSQIEETKTNIKSMELYLEKAEDLMLVIKEEDYVNTDLLMTIQTAIPQGTMVNNIYINKSNIQLDCQSNKLVDISLFIINLKETGFINNIYIPNIDEEDATYSYQILCNNVVEDYEKE